MIEPGLVYTLFLEHPKSRSRRYGIGPLWNGPTGFGPLREGTAQTQAREENVS